MVENKLSNVEVYRILADPDLISEFEEDQIRTLLTSTIASLAGIPIIGNITTSQPVMVVGDIHGDFESLRKIYNAFQVSGVEACVFLGDYVDRGDMSVEVLNFLLVLRQRYGLNVVLLRGNHEDLEVNKFYGFTTELDVKGLAGLQPFYEQLFNSLPLGCIINSTIFCIHGGIPQGIEKVADIGLLGPTAPFPFIQAVWNDPIEDSDVPDFSDNPRGEGIYYFGERAFRTFMQANGFAKLVRAHEWQPDGFRWFFGGDLLSIFSAENYNGLLNPACVAIIQGSKIEPQRL